MSAHAERVYPEECCGLIVGELSRQADNSLKSVVELVPLANQWTPEVMGNDASIASIDTQNIDKQNIGEQNIGEQNTENASLGPCAPQLPTDFSGQWPNKSPDQSPYSKQRRYYIDPQDMLRVQKRSRQQGLQIIGIYHSHPDQVAEPSECDRLLAWPTYAYVIVSVQAGKAVDVKNWTLDSEHQFQPEAIKISPCAAQSLNADSNADFSLKFV
ncbi:MAG: M67 family metallopeptidase [Phormidesmis sp. RL_2_1]|nr:M67 family metallopeptidase [Phormidesmis sp. RL_2_1]